MENISSFLNKFKNIVPPERFVKEVFIRVVSNVANITILEKEITVKKNILHIQMSSLKKNELFLHKEKLLDELNKELKSYKKVIKDIL